MQRRWTRAIPRVGPIGVCAIAALVWSCDAGEIVSDAGEAMVDAGESLMDAGGELSDGGGGDAAAQIDAGDGGPVTVEVACDIERRILVTSDATGISTETTFWYAELENPSFRQDGSTRVFFTTCGLTTFTPPSVYCPESGHTCVGDDPPALPEDDCISGYAGVSSGVARVRCGYRQTRRDGDGATTADAGWRRSTAYITVR